VLNRNQLAIYDRNYILIDILKDRKSSTVKGFLLSYSDEIKKVGMDMFMQFRMQYIPVFHMLTLWRTSTMS
jgi:hypothetical protein